MFCCKELNIEIMIKKNKIYCRKNKAGQSEIMLQT